MVNREPDMNTRRDFLKAAGAATGTFSAVVGCGMRRGLSRAADNTCQ